MTVVESDVRKSGPGFTMLAPRASPEQRSDISDADARFAALGTRAVVVVGQGYVGLPLSILAVERGFRVTGLEIDPGRVGRLNLGDSYIDDITSPRLGRALATGRFCASSDFASAAGFDIAIITVPTPLRDGAPDLSFIESAAVGLAPHVTRGCTVILESTTYPGTTEEMVVPLLESGSGLVAGVDFHVGYSPERIDPGNPRWSLENTPKVVSGISDDSLAAVQGFYSQIVERTVPVSSTRVAEMTKLLENTFRHVNVALINELAMYAHDMGIRIDEAVDAASTKPFGFMRFTPGPGVGGHCLPIDPSYLAWDVKRRLGKTFRFVELANDVNEHMPDYIVARVVDALNHHRLPLRGTRILALGLSYKPNTADIRESPSLTVVEQLLAKGADVRAVEPHVHQSRLADGVRLTTLTAREIRSAAIVLILTDHDAFDYELVSQHGRIVLDLRNRVRGTNVERL